MPHPTSCRLYYVCLNGVTPNEAGCGSGLVFNERTGKCDDPANVPGCENTYEEKVRKLSLLHEHAVLLGGETERNVNCVRDLSISRPRVIPVAASVCVMELTLG